jgi:hypothetical protein
MVDLNIPNFLTIGLVSMLAIAAVKWLMKMFGISVSWL